MDDQLLPQPIRSKSWFDYLAKIVASNLKRHADNNNVLPLRSRIDRQQRLIARWCEERGTDGHYLHDKATEAMRESIQYQKAQLTSLRFMQTEENKVSEQLWVMSVVASRKNSRSRYSGQIATALSGHGFHMDPEAIKERVSRFRRSLLVRMRSESVTVEQAQFGILCSHFENFKNADHWKKYGREIERLLDENPNASDADLLPKIAPLLLQSRFADDGFTTLIGGEQALLKKLLDVKIKSRGQRLPRSARGRSPRRVRRAREAE